MCNLATHLNTVQEYLWKCKAIPYYTQYKHNIFHLVKKITGLQNTGNVTAKKGLSVETKPEMTQLTELADDVLKTFCMLN